MSGLPYAVHVTMPQAATVGGTVFNVAQRLTLAYQALGGRSAVATPGVLPAAPGVPIIPITYDHVRWQDESQVRQDRLRGALGMRRPHLGTVYEPAIARLADERPDQVFIYEGHFACTGLPSWEPLRRKGTEVVYYVHNTLPRSCPPWELRHLLKAADRVVFVTAALRDAMMRRLGPGHGIATEVIHNGVADAFHATAPRTAAPPGDPVITFIGKVHEFKGPHLVIQAADRARRFTGRPVRVRIVGDSSYGHGGTTAYQQWLKDQSATVETPVEFIPFQPPEVLAQLLRESTVACFPSEQEAFGLVVAEAMAAGTPVVCTDLPSLREVGGDAVFTYPRDDLDGMASAMAALIEEPDRWAAASRDGWERARTYTWEATARALHRVP